MAQFYDLLQILKIPLCDTYFAYLPRDLVEFYLLGMLETCTVTFKSDTFCGQPDVIETTRYHLLGKLHRFLGPAEVQMATRRVPPLKITEKYYMYGMLHRVGGPASMVKYGDVYLDRTEYFRLYGKPHAPEGQPTCVYYGFNAGARLTEPKVKKVFDRRHQLVLRSQITDGWGWETLTEIYREHTAERQYGWSYYKLPYMNV